MMKLLKLDRYPAYLRRLWWDMAITIWMKLKGINPGPGLRCYGFPIIERSPDSEIIIGDRVVLCSDSRYTALGINHPVVLRTLEEGARIVIGADTGISGASICSAISITIGTGVLLGANTTIVDTDFHPIASNNRRYEDGFDKVQSRPVVIGSNVFIGAGSTVLKGVEIGENSVIGAGSIVTRDVPSNSIAAGNPARVIAALPDLGAPDHQ